MCDSNNINCSNLVMKKMVLAGSSNCLAASVTNPIDVIKVRMQLAGASANAADAGGGFVRGFQRIYQTEGTNGLYKGLTASLLREVAYSSIRLGLYDTVKTLLTAPGDGSVSHGNTKNNKKKPEVPFYKKVLAGGITGAVGSAIATPADVVKIRMQGDVVGRERYSGGVLKAFGDILKNEGGIGALWVGVTPTVQRAALVTATQIPTYDQSKHYLLDNGYMDEGTPLHMVCSMYAGFWTATVTCPLDVIKTRIMNDGRGGSGGGPSSSSSSVAHVARKIFRAEGLLGFYKGWFANWMRLGPHTIVTLITFEQLRALAGMPPI